MAEVRCTPAELIDDNCSAPVRGHWVADTVAGIRAEHLSGLIGLRH
jgi:hypothetical protein